MTDECPHCGMAYREFRTEITYQEVYSMYWSGNDDPSTWKYKRRNTILGRWHQIKQEMWDEHLELCERYYESRPRKGTRMTVFIDMDGTLANFTEYVIRRYEEETSLRVDISTLTHAGEVGERVGQSRLYKLMAEDGFFMELKPYPFAQEFMEGISKLGLEYYFLTKLPWSARTGWHDKAKWLYEYFGEKSNKLITASNKSIVVRPGDVLIDDDPKNLDDCSEYGALLFCIAHPWNRSMEGECYRGTLEDALKWLEGLCESSLR